MDWSSWYSEILKNAEIVDIRYGVKGFIVIRPWGMLALRNITGLFARELEKDGHLPVHFPAVIPEKNLKIEEEHFRGFMGEVFWITHAGNNLLEEKLFLRPTSETAFYPMYRLWIQGKKDLPLKLYQYGTVWRYETKATKPLIRGREFIWIETHDAFATLEEARAQVLRDLEIAKHVLREELGLNFIMLKRPEWDKFAGGEETYAFDVLLPDGKVLQVATTHLLGKKFAKAFDVKFMDEDGKSKYVNQTCFGIGLTRILAALIFVHQDGKGFVFPPAIAPIQIVIIPVWKKENKERIVTFAKEVQHLLPKFRVYFDDSEETAGYKFNEWELKGVPVRIEIGEREVAERKVTIVGRKVGKKVVSLDNLEEAVEKMLNAVLEKLKQDSSFDGKIVDAVNLETLSKAISAGKIAKVPFCSITEGEKCAKIIKESFAADVRGVRIDKAERVRGKCVVCGKPAKVYAYVAKSY